MAFALRGRGQEGSKRQIRSTGGLPLTITIYGIKNCDTMKKARAWLDHHGVAYDFYDYKAAGAPRDKLKEWSEKLGWESLLNRAGTTFRKLPDAEKEGLNEKKALALMAELWQPGWTEFAGEFHDVPRLVMEPVPSAPIPVYVGGLSEIAFARAARHDGWVGDIYTTDEAAAHAARLAEIRRELGAEGDFAVIVALTDAFTPDQFAEAERRGITDVMTMPWAYYHGLDATLEQKLDGMERFAADVLAPLGTSPEM